MNTKHTILVVEDDRAISNSFKFALEQEGYVAVIASNGEESIAAAQKSSPSLILLDLIMPKVDGFDVLKMLRKDEIMKDTPIIVFSNLSQETDREEVLKLGATAFLQKSEFSIQDVLSEITKYLPKDNG